MTELEESNRQFIDAWSMYARRAAHGAIADLGGVAVAFSRVTMPLMNMMFLSSPVKDTADLRKRLDAAVAYGHGAGFPWMITICNDWLPGDTRAQANELFASAGLAPASLATGMVAEALSPPRRATPNLEIRRVAGKDGRVAVADLNTSAYGMPLDWGHEALDREEIFAHDVWAYVGYLGGAPVTTSTTALIDGRLYVMMVATAADHQKKGYAEAVMRRSLDEAARATDVARTVLHASEIGEPLYASMGYRAVAGFTMYAEGQHGE
jgi:GNAT superfamily N-acetyltransferase